MASPAATGGLPGRGGPGIPQFPFPQFPILRNGEGNPPAFPLNFPDSAGIGNGNPRFPIRPGTGNGAAGPPRLANREIGDTLAYEHSRHDLSWQASTRNAASGGCYSSAATLIPGMIPNLPGIGDSGVHPRRHPRFAGDRGSSPSPVPIGGRGFRALLEWAARHVGY